MTSHEPDIMTLIDQSSLGTPAAKAIRASADPAAVEEILRRAAQYAAEDDSPPLC